MPEYATVLSEFSNITAEVQLIGPANVAYAAGIVRYALLRYEQQLERDPFSFNQLVGGRAIVDFIEQARSALGISEASEELPSYTDWRKTVEPLPGEGR